MKNIKIFRTDDTCGVPDEALDRLTETVARHFEIITNVLQENKLALTIGDIYPRVKFYPDNGKRPPIECRWEGNESSFFEDEDDYDDWINYDGQYAGWQSSANTC